MEFKELEKGKISEVEGKILAKWKEENILEKTIENRKDNETYFMMDQYMLMLNLVYIMCFLKQSKIHFVNIKQ